MVYTKDKHRSFRPVFGSAQRPCLRVSIHFRIHRIATETKQHVHTIMLSYFLYSCFRLVIFIMFANYLHSPPFMYNNIYIPHHVDIL